MKLASNYLYKFFLLLNLGFVSQVVWGSAPATPAPTTPTASTITCPNLQDNPSVGVAYTDEFGPLQSHYSMGDFVRYTVTPNYTIYDNLVTIAYAQDIYNYGQNPDNLYNTLGYLYAGYAALNINSSFVTAYNAKNKRNIPTYVTPSELQPNNWLTAYRNAGTSLSYTLWNGASFSGTASLDWFDNNQFALATIQLVDLPDIVKTVLVVHGFQSYGITVKYRNTWNAPTQEQEDQGYDLSGFRNWGDWTKANGSCSWAVNSGSGDLTLGMHDNVLNPEFCKNNPNAMTVSATYANHHYVAMPYGQFFGARIAHILGAVVNDVPASTVASACMLPTGTPMPQIAVMNGGPYNATNPAPAGMTTTSTAHFGTLERFLTNLSIPHKVSLTSPDVGSYLTNHLLPAVTRLATVCSYEIYTSETPTMNNLINIADSGVTAYDNGLIVDIANNTGDSLIVHQITSAGDDVIGTLDVGNHNYFLHTASLMQAPAASATASTPVAGEPIVGNMIKLEDATAQSSVFIQVVNPDQLATIVQNLNAALVIVATTAATAASAAATTPKEQQAAQLETQNAPATASDYNQGGTYDQPTNAAYLVITNFNPTTLATDTTISGAELLMYRIQAVNLSEFLTQPYFATLRVDKDDIGYGLQNNELLEGQAGSSILYPSIVSMKTCTWANQLDDVQNQEAKSVNYYSAMPLLLVPDFIWTADIVGLQAHYGIWLTAYIAALTEFQFNCAFGDNLGCLQSPFGLFDIVNQQPPARVVIDAQGNLVSGQYLLLDQPTVSADEPLQANTPYMALIGSDVWDIGQDFHQDIPILNLSKDANGNVVANEYNAPFINFTVTVQETNATLTTSTSTTLEPTTFAQGYGTPYQNMMFYSLPTPDLTAGVIGELSQLTAGNYQLVFTDAANNVLAVQEVYIANAVSNSVSIDINFLNNMQANWTSSVVLPSSITSVAIGDTKKFVLSYQGSQTLNSLHYESFAAQQAQEQTKTAYQAALQTLQTSVPNPKKYAWFDPSTYVAGNDEQAEVTVFVDQNIYQLWLHPEFSDGSTAELAVHSKFPAQFKLIAQHLAQGNSVAISCALNVATSQLSFVTYDAHSLKQIGKVCTFKKLVNSQSGKQKTPIAQNETLKTFEIEYLTTDAAITTIIPAPNSVILLTASKEASPVPVLQVLKGAQLQTVTLSPEFAPYDKNKQVKPLQLSKKNLAKINAALKHAHTVNLIFEVQSGLGGLSWDLHYQADDVTKNGVLCDGVFKNVMIKEYMHKGAGYSEVVGKVETSYKDMAVNVSYQTSTASKSKQLKNVDNIVQIKPVTTLTTGSLKPSSKPTAK